MSAVVVPAGGGTSHDWSRDHVFVKAPMDLTDERVTVVEDVLKPGFPSPGTTTGAWWRSSTSSTAR